MYREIAVEQLRLVAANAQLAAEHGDILDDAGLSHSARRAWLHLKEAADTLKLLADHQDRPVAQAVGGDRARR